MWCRLAHIGRENEQMRMPLTPGYEAPTTPTFIGCQNDEHRDRVNPFNPRVVDEEAAAVNTGLIDEWMDDVSETGSFSLQDDYIAL
jgi:hypothetical protein